MGDIFHRLPNLTRICFNECGDENLENVAKFHPKVVAIGVCLSNVTDNGVENLVKSKNGMVPCPELKNIFVFPSKVTDKGDECLIRNLSSLERTGHVNVPLLLLSIHQENLIYVLVFNLILI